MEPPFLVLRSEGRVVAAVPILELFQLQRAARMLMRSALGGDPTSKAQVESVFAQALDPSHPEHARSVIATFLLKEALVEAEQIREQQQAWVAAQQQQVVQAPEQTYPQPGPPGPPPGPPQGPPPTVGQCVHGRPTDIQCVFCEAEKPARKTEAA